MDSQEHNSTPTSAARTQTPAGVLMDLEDVVWTAALAAELADYVAVQAIGDIEMSKPNTLTSYEADLLLFATMQARKAADAVRDAYRETFAAVRAMEAS